MKKVTVCFFTTLLSIGCLVSSVVPKKDFTQVIKKEVLANGMTVLMYKNTAVPKVRVQVAYDIGSYAETSGERGLAHLIEHMIFKGTQKLSETDLDAIARKYGASYNAFTSRDMTSYYFETDKNNWKPFLSILSDCMQNARFEEQHLSSELWAVIQELKMYKDHVMRLMMEKIVANTFPAHHPYHAPIIGYKEDLLGLDTDKLKAFYQKYYHPDHALLVIVGDIDFDEVMEVVTAEFAGIPAKESPVNITFPARSHELSATKTTCYEDVKNNQLALSWNIPGLKDAQEHVSTVAAYLLGSGENSRLHKRLVDEEQVAASVAVFPYKLMHDGVFFIFVEPLEGKNEVCRNLVFEELERAVAEGFTEQELLYMLSAQKKAFYAKLESLSGLSMELVESYFASSDEHAIFKKVDLYTSTTSDDVQVFIQQFLDPLVVNSLEVLSLPDNKKDQIIKIKEESDALDKKILTTRPRTAPLEAPSFFHKMQDPTMLDFAFPKPDKVITLANGMTILLQSHRDLPLLSLRCRFKDATYHTRVLESWLLDIMMGSLIEDSGEYSKFDNVDFFDSRGVDYSFSEDGASLSLLSDEYKTIFERFLYVLRNPTFPEDVIEKIREIMLNSLQEAKDDQSRVASKALMNLIYRNHPYAWTYDDAEKLLNDFTVEDIRRIHQKMLIPNNIIMSVVGDFDVDEMETTLREIFESWERQDRIPVVYGQSLYEKQGVVTIPMVRDQVYLKLGQPSQFSMNHPDYIIIRLLNSIAFNGLGSRIFHLRETSGLFYTASGAWANGATMVENGCDFVSTMLTPNNVEIAEVKIKALIKELQEKGVTEQELAAARQLYFKGVIDLVASNSSKASMMCMMNDLGLPIDHYDTMLQKVRAVKLDDINRVAREYFSTDNMTSIRVGRV